MSGSEPWVIKAKDSFLLDCKSQTKKVAQSLGSGLVNSHKKGMLVGPLLLLNDQPKTKTSLRPALGLLSR